MALCLSVCPSVCPLQVGALSKRLNRSIWILAHGLPSTYPTLLYTHSGIAEIRVLLSGMLSQTLSVETFATAPCTSTVTSKPLRATRWAWGSASRGSVCVSSDLFAHLCSCHQAVTANGRWRSGSAAGYR